MTSQIAKFMGSTWGPPGSCRTPDLGPMLALWTLLSGVIIVFWKLTGVAEGSRPFRMTVTDKSNPTVEDNTVTIGTGVFCAVWEKKRWQSRSLDAQWLRPRTTFKKMDILHTATHYAFYIHYTCMHAYTLMFDLDCALAQGSGIE